MSERNLQLPVIIVVLHWLMATGVLISLVSGFWGMASPDHQPVLAQLHYISSSVALFAVFSRLVYIRTHPGATTTATQTPSRRRMNLALSWLLQLTVVLMGFSGALLLVTDTETLETATHWAVMLHHFSGYLLFMLVVLHVIVTIGFEWVFEDGSIHRMLGRNVANKYFRNHPVN